MKETAEQLISTVLGLVYPESDVPTNAAGSLQVILDDNRETLEVYKRCLSEGTDFAVASTREMIQWSLIALEETYQPDADIDPGDYNDLTHPQSVIDILRVWNMANVFVESKDTTDFWEALTELGVMETVFSHLDPLKNNYRSDVYWRGAAALSRIPAAAPSDTDIAQFIEYAGSHRDVGAVIDLVKQRGVFLTATIESMLAVQHDAVSSLRSGTL